MTKSFFGHYQLKYLSVVILVISLLVCVSSSTPTRNLNSRSDDVIEFNSVNPDLENCEQATHVLVTLDFSSILSFYLANGVGSENYTSYSIYTLNNTRVIEDVVDTNTKQHCLAADDYKFLVEPLETEHSSVGSSEYVYAPVVISAERFTGSNVIFKSPIVEPLILHLQLNVFPWAAGVQEWFYTQSVEENEAYLNPTYNISQWIRVTQLPSMTSTTSHYYFRSHFTLTSLADIPGFEIRLRSTSSITLSINGIQVYSDPSNSRATGVASSPPWTTINGVASYLRVGTNTVVLDLRPLTSIYGDLHHSFDMTLRLLHSYPYYSFNNNVVPVPISASKLFDGDFAANWSTTVSLDSYSVVRWSYPRDFSYNINKICIIKTSTGSLPSRIDFYGFLESRMIEIQSFYYDPDLFDTSSPCWEVQNFVGFREYEVWLYPSSTSNQLSFSEFLFQNMIPSSPFLLDYPVSSISISVGDEDSCIAPTFDDDLVVGFCDIDDVLPEGVSIDKATGEVCVEGSVFSAVNITVTVYCHSQLGGNSTSLHLTRYFQACSTDGGFIDHGEVVTVGPCDEGYSGNKIRVCNNGVLSEVQDDQCVMLSPENLSYTLEEYYVVYNAISLTPTVSNIVTLFTINDTLPEGLTMDSETGVIAGSPESPCDLYLLITASNSQGQTSTEIHLVIKLRSCEEDGWGLTESGDEAIREDCGDGYEGYVTRLCTDGVFGEISRDHCILKAPEGLYYQSTSDDTQLFVFDKIELVPILTGLNVTFSCDSLPDGLTLNENSGVIEGMLRSDENVTFTIVAENTGGKCSTVLSLSPVYRPCSALSYIQQGEVGDMLWIDCGFREMTGSVLFECIVDGETVRWVEKESHCERKNEFVWLIVVVAVVACGIIVVVLFVIILAKKKQSTVRVRTVSTCYI